VLGAFGEPAAPPDTLPELAAELRDLAAWLDLDAIEVIPGRTDRFSRDLGCLLRPGQQ
jgi:hypothetical protein